MTNSTEVYWDVDGVSLQTYAWNIVTIGGDREAPPTLRGGNLLVPYAPGRTYMPKVVDTRTITLGMWVQGSNEDGTIPSDVRTEYDENWRMLKKLLWTPNRQVELTKRFYVDGELKTATAMAQFASGLTPLMTGRARASFTVDLVLADPYFYGPEIVTPLSTGITTGGTFSVDVEGDDVTRAIQFHVDGPRVNVKVKNNTRDVDMEYHATLNSGDDLDVDVAKFSSITTPNAGLPYKSLANIRHTGSPFLFELEPGTNSLTISATSGIGLVTMTHQEVWL